MSSRSPSSLLTRQPGKGLWTFATLATLPARLVFVLIYNLFPFLRAHPKWTYHQAVGKAVFAMWWNYASTVEFRPAKSLEPGSDGTRFVVMKPASSDIYQGMMASNPAVCPATVGGMWYPRAYDHATDAGKKIAIHFHGGAYVLGGCRPMEGGFGPLVLANQLDGFVLQPQYRLAMDDATCFPAPIQDGLTSYAHLLALGVAPSDIVFSGESAGGNLVVAMIRHLVEQKGTLPLPSAVLLWSPWLDLANLPRALESQRKVSSDYLSADLLSWGARKYVPSGVSPKDPYISPLYGAFAIPVPVFLQVGGSEVFQDDIVKFYHQMRELKGNRVELVEIKDAPHDTFGAGAILGFVKEANDAATSASKFVKNV